MAEVRRQLPDLHETAVLRGFLDPAEHSCLLQWAEAQLACGTLKSNTHGEHRYFHSYGKADPAVPLLFWRVRQRAVSVFSVRDYEDEPNYRCFLGCNTEGGFVHRHTDPSPSRRLHVRMNIMLSRPAGGGMPVIDGQEFDIAEGDLWCFYPTIMPHESTPVLGERKRFVLSIGILIPEKPDGHAPNLAGYGKIN